MSRWFRVHDDMVDDPKVQRLPADLFKALINLWCLASQNDGRLPDAEDVSFKLRMTPSKTAETITRLVRAGLIDESEEGFEPHNWAVRQFKSDITDPTAPERMRRYRKNRKSVTQNTVTVTDTREQIQIQITDTEQKDSCAVAPATRPRPSDEFEEFWKAYPKRDGANPKAPARKAFLAAIKAGTEASEIVAGANACAAKDRDKIGTPYIPQAVKWLRDKRWEDYAATGPPAGGGPPKPPDPTLPSHEELLKRYANGRSNSPESSSEISSGGRAIPIDPHNRATDGDQTRKPRMASLGEVFSRIPGLRAGGDAEDQHRSESGQGDDGPDPMARVV